MRSRYSWYCGTSVRDGISCAMKVTRSMYSGCCSRKVSKAEKPRSTFFERSARSTRRIMKSRRRRSSSASNSATRGRFAAAQRRGVVDRQRVGADPDLAALPDDDAAVVVDLGADQLAAALQEVAPVGLRVEADDVVGEQAGVELLADPRRQHAPRVRLRPGDVDEVVQEDVRAGAAHELGQRVEVVVVDHHDRVLDVLDLLDDGAREVLVDDVVAELERLDLVAADVRRVGEIPQVVLDEPQHRVGEDVVEAVVGLGRGLDEPHEVVAAGRRGDLEGAAAVAVRDGGVVLAHRRGDPDQLAVGGEAAQRRDEAAACRAGPIRRPRRSPGRGWRPGRADGGTGSSRADGCWGARRRLLAGEGVGRDRHRGGDARRCPRAGQPRALTPVPAARIRVKVVSPGAESTSRRAPICTASSCAIASPSPAPRAPSAP